MTLWKCDGLDLASDGTETEAEFRERLIGPAKRLLDEELHEMETRYDKKIEKAEAAVAKKESYYNEQSSQFWSGLLGVGLKVLEVVFALLSGKATSRKTSSSVSAAKSASTERSQSNRAKQALDEAVADLEALREERDRNLEEVREAHRPEKIELERLDLSP